MEEAKHYADKRVIYTKDALDAIKGADALLLVTEWPEFRLPDWNKIKNVMNGHIIFDGRNIYNASDIAKAGFTYYGIGLQPKN
jgi:UDPglucose 6-dehydrogenase